MYHIIPDVDTTSVAIPALLLYLSFFTLCIYAPENICKKNTNK